jgi:hypothetical protein
MSALSEPGVLHHVLSYVGPGQFIYVSICREWRAVYTEINKQQAVCRHASRNSAACTAHPAIFASEKRLTLAVELGLDLSIAHDSRLQIAAGKFASKEVLLVAKELGLPFTFNLTIGATACKDLAKLQWLHLEQDVELPGCLCAVAAEVGNVDALRWLQEIGEVVVYDAAVLTTAARNGQLEAVQHLNPFVQADLRASDACVVAAQFDHLNTLKLLINVSEAGYAITYAVLKAAARGGSLLVLQWLYQQLQQQPASGPSMFDDTLMLCAIQHGHLAAVEWLSECAGCSMPSDAECYHFAAANGHTHILLWLREHGIECDTAKLCVSAAQSGCMCTIEYALEMYAAERGDAPPVQLLTDMQAAGGHHQLAVAQWLRLQGADWSTSLSYTNSFDGVVLCWRGTVRDWTRDEGFPIA